MFRSRQSQSKTNADDSHLRFDYVPAEARHRGRAQKGFAQIKRMFVHESYPGGPSRVVVDGEWLQNMGMCEVAGTTLVKRNTNHPFNHSSRFVFLDNCYNRPVALWPHDPFDGLGEGHPRKECFDVIDRNQDENFE